MEFRIRDFVPSDYKEIADIQRIVSPRNSMSAEALERWDQSLSSYFRKRWVVEKQRPNGAQLVAVAVTGESPWTNEPGSYHVGISVLPEFRKMGIGASLYTQALDALKSRNPSELKAQASTDESAGMSFLQKRGFVEFNRRFSLSMNLRTPSTAQLIQRLPEQLNGLRKLGISIRSLKEAGRSDELDRKLHALESEIAPDIPGLPNFSPMPFEEFKNLILNPVNIPPEGYMIAFAGSEPVGYTSLFTGMNSKKLQISMTGIRRQWRGKGLASALKITAIQAAVSMDYPELGTTNDQTNESILALNRKLGFQVKSGIVEFRKKLHRT